MHSRFPNPGWENGITAGPYSVFHGFNDLFQDFEAGCRRLGTTVHANLFAPRRARFAGGADVLQRRVERIGQAAGLQSRGVSDQPDLEHAG
jgi:hypothetical protein